MKRLPGLALSLVVAGGLPALCDDPPPPAEDFPRGPPPAPAFEYASPKWGFAARFPWQPREVPLPAKHAFSVVAANARGTIEYTIATGSVDRDGLSREEILDGLLGSVLVKYDGALESTRSVTLDGMPGRMAVLAVEGRLCDCRAYLDAADHYYVAGVVYPRGARLPMPASTFHASLHVTPRRQDPR